MWDNTLLEKVKRDKTSHANVDLVYFRFKKFIIFSPKEYTDKQIIFADGDVIYTFRTTNQKGVEETPVDPSLAPADRCESIVSIQMIYRDADGTVIFENMVQGDNKITYLPGWVLSMTAPKAISEWFKNWRTFLEKEMEGVLAQN